MDDNTACHLHYGTSRTFKDKHRMLVFNMGATSTQVSIAEYSTIEKLQANKNATFGVFEMKAKAWEESLGGNDFDIALIDHFANDFNKKHRTAGMVSS